VSKSVYTLLIVESPVLARMIQSVCPSSVYVLATGGFCWRPCYDSSESKLKAQADPEKRSFRNELKKQAQFANRIVIATDQDPSGDFIAWSTARYLKRSGIQRGNLQNISRKGILSMLSDVQEIDFSRLETQLKNLFLIRHEWNRSSLPDKALAGLTAIFGTSGKYRHFLNQNGELYHSSGELSCSQDELIPVQPVSSSNHIPVHKPLSTFDLFSPAMAQNLGENYREVQLLLQQLFQTELQFSNESLISYPRTSARAFYSETWETIRSQYMKIGPVSELKPLFLQEIADPDLPHESIHPFNLAFTPDEVKGELPQKVGHLYGWIYHRTLSCITLPEPLKISYTNELYPGFYFYRDIEEEDPAGTTSLRPCLTVSDLGIALNKLNIAKPSAIGKNLDEWEMKKWIRIEGEIVKPGDTILKHLNNANSFLNKLTELKSLSENKSLSIETVRAVLAS
jgi:hypothetical protein